MTAENQENLILKQSEETKVAAVPTGNAGLWRDLSDRSDLGKQAQSWAALMHAQLDENASTNPVAVFAFRYDLPSRQLTPIGGHPKNRVGSALAIDAAQSAVDNGRPVARGEMPGNESQPLMQPMAAAAPLMVKDVPVGVVVVEMRPNTQTDMRWAMRRLQWSAAWLRDTMRAEESQREETRYTAAVEALNTIIVVAEREDFMTAASATVTDLATRFDCDRVALGLRRFRRTKVRAISHSAQFSKRMELVARLNAAMDEAVDQRAAVLWPDDNTEEVFATHAAAALAREHGAGHIYTVPLYSNGKFIGALTFERPSDKPFDERQLDVLEAVSTVLAPILDEKRRNDRWLITKIAESGLVQLKRLLGPAHLIRKLFVACVIGLVIFFWFARANYEVSAEARVVGTIERSVVPGFDGFIATAPVRAGDEVAQGDLLVQLDDRDLTLERLRLVTQRQRQQIEFDRAVAARDRAEINIRQTLIDQADAEIGLLDEQIRRTRLQAPFDGLVVSGDLSQSIGSAVSRGETLLTIAPADAYRVILQVDERQIADLQPGQSGALRVTALPDQTFTIAVEKITPVATYAEGATTFEVEALFAGDVIALRPGMQGAARIEVDERRLIAIWTKPLLDWARITLWRWMPV
ncbi:efflux RND transporter periplasmic adaptor subunit [Yoonia sp. GPGPB17]|uniref:efflux RND transporter periplasmic adaptor subunit n=1 Tax=Yoonia sp. GPGPB17 TaxID=3026147 RepID=UPI0030C40B89